jgi:hypothetical protein
MIISLKADICGEVGSCLDGACLRRRQQPCGAVVKFLSVGQEHNGSCFRGRGILANVRAATA